MDFASALKMSSEQGNQADRLSAENTELQEVRRLELTKQQLPHNVESMLAKTSAVFRKVTAVCSDLRWKLLIKVSQAFKIKLGRHFQTSRPIESFDAHGWLADRDPAMQASFGHGVIF